ncbi:restriction endonuclease subunit S [Cellulomonas cellasea]|uniref:restriction endonuclease subunit S n=1 Tax=Cellulomonas cellasea TaxID=43670 RepID=UPI0025A4043F|nr:restriction endonuclease subunit S [Cellulomonas cellasea]MDM8084882.1 restriction endonuclease subunit S [Cellulomonas cellasea]
MARAGVPLRHLVTCLDGRRVPLNASERAEIPGEIPYWGAGGVVDHVARPLFSEALVLLGEDGAPFFEPGKDVAHVVHTPVWVNNHIHVLRPHPSVDSRYLTYSLNAVDYAQYISGSTRDKLTQDDMRRITVCLPPLNEQRRIADFLDTATNHIDRSAAIRLRQEDLELERWRSVVAETALCEAGDNMPLKRLFESSFAGAWGGDPGIEETDVLCARVADFDREYYRVTAAPTVRSVTRRDAARKSLREGDILLEKSGGTQAKPVGCAVMYEGEPGAVCSNFIQALRPRRDVSARFVGYIMGALYETRQNGAFVNQTTGIQNLDLPAYMRTLVRIPSLSEQLSAVHALDEMRSHIMSTRALLHRSGDLLIERRQALITAAVTGQIDVTTTGSATP